MSIDVITNNPFYSELADKLKKDIQTGVYGPGDRMPSEPTLCKVTGYSRSTVRKVLQLLVDQGYVVRSQGKGTFVADQIAKEPLADPLMPRFMSFSQSVQSLGSVPLTRTIDIRSIPATPGLAAFFDVSEGTSLYEVTRLRSADGEPVCLETIWMPMKFADITGDELNGSFYEALRKRYGVEPATGTKAISICYANSRESFQLDVPRDSALMLIEDHVYDKEGNPLHISKQVARGDKNRYVMHIPEVDR